MRSIDARIERLEASLKANQNGRLPMIVDDDTSEEELARLRLLGGKVLRFSEMVDLCVVERAA